MTKEILIFAHMDEHYPSYIEQTLGKRGVSYRVIKSYAGDTVPQLDNTIAGLVFMGGEMSVNDNLPWLNQELRLIRQAIDANLPILGHCLGGQLISKAFGQTISTNPVPEIGWYNCHPSQAPQAQPWLAGLNNPFPMFHWHFESFDLPQGAQLLFSSQHCNNQAYVINNNILAMQCHVEMTTDMIRHWMHRWGNLLTNNNASEQTEQQIMQNLETKVTSLNVVADQLYRQWLAIGKLA